MFLDNNYVNIFEEILLFNAYEWWKKKFMRLLPNHSVIVLWNLTFLIVEVDVILEILFLLIKYSFLTPLNALYHSEKKLMIKLWLPTNYLFNSLGAFWNVSLTVSEHRCFTLIYLNKLLIGFFNSILYFI